MSEPIKFFDLHDGLLGKDVQEKFEEAQRITFNNNQDTKIRLEITVKAHNPEFPSLANVLYKTELIKAKRNPITVHTMLDETGMIKQTGKTFQEVIQADLFHG